MPPSLLIISANLTSETLCEEPFSLSPEKFFLCSPGSLAFIPIKRYPIVVLHDFSENTIRKVALGLRDNPESEALWEVMANRSKSVYQLVSAATRPSPDCFALGIEIITPTDLRTLIDHQETSDYNSGAEHSSEIVTAEEIREMHQNGVTTISESVRLTPWAKEVADSLGMLVSDEPRDLILLDLGSITKIRLAEMKENLFSWNRQFQKLLFVLPAPYFPIFNEMFPPLKGRIVAPSIHFEEKGAFTGEISLSMLIDSACAGAILPNFSRKTDPKQMKNFFSRAEKHGILLFSTKSLEPTYEYDIIAPPETGRTKFPIPIVSGQRKSAQPHDSYARLFTVESFENKLKKGSTK